jgi:hypothetical protein
VYQCLALEASRAQYSRDKTEMARRGVDILTNSIINANDNNNAARGNQGSANEIVSYQPGILDLYFRAYDRAKKFFRTNEIGRGISVLFPFVGLVALGALVVGPIEEWSPLEAVYFSVVSLTTVG